MPQKLEYTKLNHESYDYLNNYFTHKLRNGYVKCRGTVLPEYFQEFGDSILNANIRPDDLWLCSFPKTGTTWVQEMIWSISNIAIYESVSKPLSKRFPYLESSMIFDFRNCETGNPHGEDYDSIKNVDNLPSPRFIKTHLPFQLLPMQLQTTTTVKMVYVMRNPADACVSFYYHSKWIEGYKGGFDEFCDLFLEGKVLYGPYWDHVMGFWNRRNNPNLLIIKYEDMKKNLKSVISKTANFLEKALTDEQIENLIHHLSFESMKKNPVVNKEGFTKNFVSQLGITDESGDFIRAGKVGEWKETMKPELQDRFRVWMNENLRNSGLTFDFA